MRGGWVGSEGLALGSGSHTNIVVVLLHWSGALGALPWKSWENGVFGAILGHFLANTKMADDFLPIK